MKTILPFRTDFLDAGFTCKTCIFGISIYSPSENELVSVMCNLFPKTVRKGPLDFCGQGISFSTLNAFNSANRENANENV